MAPRRSIGTTPRVIALLGAALLLAACSTSSPAATTNLEPTQGATASTGPTTPPGTTPPATEAPPTEVPPTAAPATEAPPTEAPTIEPGGSPAASVSPEVLSLTIKRTADCASDNGTGTVGMIQISWDAVGTTGVRISIDPPSPDVAYGYGYADYAATGSADVPFACSPPNHDAKGDYHLYVVTTIHTTGHYYWRYAKVYQTTP